MNKEDENRYIRYLKTKIKMQVWWKDRVRKMLCNETAKAVLFGTPLHGNLGDQALALAIYNFFESCGIHEADVVEIPTAILEGLTKGQIKKIAKDRIIFLQGGGFMGNTWMQEEIQIRRFIQSCPNNKIIILPQTITYTDDKEGNKEKRKANKIYGACRNIEVYVREKESVKAACELVGQEKVNCVPDMVIGYLKEAYGVVDRKNKCLFCMRDDREKLVDEDKVTIVGNAIKNLGLEIEYTDTIVSGYIYPEQRKEKVLEKLQEFSKVQLVITDRLHGMLFAAITGTPCLFFDNKNGKVQNVFEWIKDIKYVKPITDMNNIEEEIQIVLENRGRYPAQRYISQYDALTMKVRKLFKCE